MGQMLRYIKQRYNDPEIFIAENGFSVKGEAEMDLPSALGDAARIDYFKGYLDSMKQAINESKCRVKGYIAWSLMDNFEWAVGFSDKFGAVHVDMDTQVRTKKASFYYLKRYFGISIKKE